MSYKKEYYVYAHISPSNKYYIGVTSIGLNKRFGNGNGYKKHKHFCNAILKYGWDNFQHEIIAGKITKDEAFNFEKILINKLQSNNPLFGYNLSDGGESGVKGFHYIMSDEHKQKISKSHIGIRPSEETKQKIREKVLGKTASEETKEKMRIVNTGRKHTQDSKDKISNWHKGRKKWYPANKSKGKPVCQYNLKGEFVAEFPSAKEAQRRTGFSQSCISKCCNGDMLFFKNYIWRYECNVSGMSNIIIDNDTFIKIKKLMKNKQIQQFTLNGELINIFNSCREASRITGFSFSNISNCCTSRYKQANGYVWRYMVDNEKVI